MSAKFLNTKNLMTAFAVSHMTIQHWRKGSASRYPLPTVTVKGQPLAVAFSPSQVRAWAKQNKVELVVADLESLMTDAPEAKPGPKAKAKAKAKAPAKTAKTLRKAAAAKQFTQAIAAKTAKGVVKPAAKKASPLKGTKVSAKPTETKPAAKRPRLRVVPAKTQQAA